MNSKVFKKALVCLTLAIPFATSSSYCSSDIKNNTVIINNVPEMKNSQEIKPILEKDEPKIDELKIKEENKNLDNKELNEISSAIKRGDMAMIMQILNENELIKKQVIERLKNEINTKSFDSTKLQIGRNNQFQVQPSKIKKHDNLVIVKDNPLTLDTIEKKPFEVTSADDNNAFEIPALEKEALEMEYVDDITLLSKEKQENVVEWVEGIELLGTEPEENVVENVNEIGLLGTEPEENVKKTDPNVNQIKEKDNSKYNDMTKHTVNNNYKITTNQYMMSEKKELSKILNPKSVKNFLNNIENILNTNIDLGDINDYRKQLAEIQQNYGTNNNKGKEQSIEKLIQTLNIYEKNREYLSNSLSQTKNTITSNINIKDKYCDNSNNKLEHKILVSNDLKKLAEDCVNKANITKPYRNQVAKMLQQISDKLKQKQSNDSYFSILLDEYSKLLLKYNEWRNNLSIFYSNLNSKITLEKDLLQDENKENKENQETVIDNELQASKEMVNKITNEINTASQNVALLLLFLQSMK